MTAFFVWWLMCAATWSAILFWSYWPEVRLDDERKGFAAGMMLQLVLWPVSVASHVVAETAWGRRRGMSLLFSRWRSK